MSQDTDGPSPMQSWARNVELKAKMDAILLAGHEQAEGKPITATCSVCHGLLRVERLNYGDFGATYVGCDNGCARSRAGWRRKPLSEP